MRLIGQDVSQIMKRIEFFEAGLNAHDKPAGSFMLSGPTGTGKTMTAEYLAWKLHGNPKNYLRIDCAEFALAHETAKLIGAPPGYLGHRETGALLSTKALEDVRSKHSKLSIVLFDEIEKASPSFYQLLLGILDKGRLTLGDNTTVHWERTLVLLTNNLVKDERSSPGFVPAISASGSARAAHAKWFSPEFIGRLDGVLKFRPLVESEVKQILEDYWDELVLDLLSKGYDDVGFSVKRAIWKEWIALGTGREGIRPAKRAMFEELTGRCLDSYRTSKRAKAA